MLILVEKTHAYFLINLCFQFQEAEKKRYRAEQQRFETKHQRQLEEARATAQSAIKELEQLQNEKRKMLMEHETLKLKELDECYAQELREWKAQLKPRKQVIKISKFYVFSMSNWDTLKLHLYSVCSLLTLYSFFYFFPFQNLLSVHF